MSLPLVQAPGEAQWGFDSDPPFALAESWLGKKLSSDATPGSAGTLVVRCLAAMGPSSIAELQSWSGLRPLRETVNALRPQLVTFQDERKRELFDLPEAPRPTEDTEAPVRFIPDYDNLIVGRTDARILAAEHRAAVFRPGLRVLPTFLIDGKVAGTWSIERKKKTAALLLSAFAAVPAKARRALEAEGERLLSFTEEKAGEQRSIRWS